MSAPEQVFARLRDQFAGLEQYALHGPSEALRNENLQKAKLISAMIEHVMTLATPLPAGSGNTATIDCPHCSNAIKVTLSK
jgi:hypothetical protein